jgi:hypothetical protein
MTQTTELGRWSETAWMLFLLMLLILLAWGRQGLEWILMKAYQFFIQQPGF